MLFPKAANKGIRQPKTCKLKIIHNKKEKNCKFFVAQNGSPAVLGMQDIDKLGLISVNYNTMHRQVAEDDSIDNSENQTDGSKCEQFKGEKQEEEVQSTQDADNTPKPPVVLNPMVTGINNNDNDLIADLIADTRNNVSIDFCRAVK